MNRASRSRFITHHFHPGSELRWLLLCDHASNRVPPELQQLGLPPEQLARHIAWDIGAAAVARRLARTLRAPLAEHGVSRLVADPNRAFDDAALIPEVSDGTLVPGNQALDPVERERRWVRWHQPYHRRVARHLDWLAVSAIRPLVVSVHSFTPYMNGKPRRWSVGVLWRDDESLARLLIEELGRDGTEVGDNEPYDGRLLMGYSVPTHAIERGLPYTTIELRQDLLVNPAGRAFWARKLYRALTAARARWSGEDPAAG